MSGVDPPPGRVCHAQVDGSVKEQQAPYSGEIGRAPIAALGGVTCGRSCACSVLNSWRAFSL